ncbi:MAG: ATP-dependent DNA helicase [Deltaproteobacteria bacterium]|nr:ATP-dependent DNA helicase [Deltaproteobacteria bacterium]
MPTSPKIEQTPTTNQKRAIELTAKSIAIIAGAGSGKTKVLTGRLVHLLKNKKITLNQILCITFTERAAQELKNRIALLLPPEMKKELPFAPIGTFHGFCLNILREQAALIGLSEWLSVWDEHTARLAIHKVCRATLLNGLDAKDPHAVFLTEALEFKNALELLEELMSFRWHADRAVILSEAKNPGDTQEEALFEATRSLYQRALATYTLEKEKHQVLDFQDLEILTLKLLKENRETLKIYQKKFRHILVDEVQDINDLQRELIELLFVPGTNILCIVGDPKQSIYRFRGANAEGFQTLVKKITEAGGETIILRDNFRSRPGVLRFVNHTFRHLFSLGEDFELKPAREEKASMALTLLPIVLPNGGNTEAMRKEEAREVAQYILATVNAGEARFGDICLLFQAFTDIGFYEEAFRASKIPYRLFGGRGFLSAQEVIDLLFVLQVMVNLENRLALVGLMRSPLLGLSDIFITKLCLEHANDLGKSLLELPEAKWLQDLHLQKNSLSSAEILEKTVTITHYDCLLKALDPSDAKRANVEQLIELTRQLETAENLSIKNLLEYYEALKKKRSPMAQATAVDLSEEACQMMTVHGAKGLEFPIVIVADLIRGQRSSGNDYLFLRDEGLAFVLKKNPDELYSDTFPSPRLEQLKEREDYQSLEERKRLLYVALTRAEEKIVLPWHAEAARTGKWYGWLKEAIDGYTEVERWKKSEHFSQQKNDAKKSFQEMFPILERGHLTTGGVPWYTVTELEKIDTPPSPHARSRTQNAQKGGLKGTDLGNWIHATLKEWNGKQLLPMETIARTKLLELGIVATQKEFEEGLAQIEHFLKSPIAPPDFGGWHELPFNLKLPNAHVTGIIDYAWETDAGWILFDFKTDAAAFAEKYQLQMDTYALALSKGQPKKVLETRLLFLKSDKAHIEACTPERLKQTEERLIKVIYSAMVLSA